MIYPMYIQGSYLAVAAAAEGLGGGCRGRYTQGAGGKADVKRFHSRLMGAGGERKSQIYSGGLPG